MVIIKGPPERFESRIQCVLYHVISGSGIPGVSPVTVAGCHSWWYGIDDVLRNKVEVLATEWRKAVIIQCEDVIRVKRQNGGEVVRKVILGRNDRPELFEYNRHRLFQVRDQWRLIGRSINRSCGLNSKVDEKDARIRKIESQNADLERQNAELRKRIEKLEASIGSLTADR